MDHLKILDEKVKATTGKSWQQWFLVLDKLKAKDKGHYETAKHLSQKYKLSGWWSQVVTIRYEKEKGYWECHNKSSKM